MWTNCTGQDTTQFRDPEEFEERVEREVHAREELAEVSEFPDYM